MKVERSTSVGFLHSVTHLWWPGGDWQNRAQNVNFNVNGLLYCSVRHAFKEFEYLKMFL